MIEGLMIFSVRDTRSKPPAVRIFIATDCGWLALNVFLAA
ncbi:hypothetical protein CCUG60885_00396 [Mycobacteroides salmoniphilum]|uniref:Uncharacterized protein n=1 Tax=Mycobacteroides salmoniphilum TaxID=404941 RepID=A0A4R8SLF1_9MYCO|nr:hypothetical protein CCUG60885_00396 [Mycobacteroides salmoniphilum]TEA03056.1 hypothetical protein CCUG60883_03680 [Mycobacteroides salmoniphilum]